jgi:hypothetical protein
MITLTKKSPLTGRENTLTIDAEVVDYLKWQDGTLIQQAMPYLSLDEREWLITGIYPGEWDEFIFCGVGSGCQ